MDTHTDQTAMWLIQIMPTFWIHSTKNPATMDKSDEFFSQDAGKIATLGIYAKSTSASFPTCLYYIVEYWDQEIDA